MKDVQVFLWNLQSQERQILGAYFYRQYQLFFYQSALCPVTIVSVTDQTKSVVAVCKMLRVRKMYLVNVLMQSINN